LIVEFNHFDDLARVLALSIFSSILATLSSDIQAMSRQSVYFILPEDR